MWIVELAALAERLKSCGVIGAGGAGFPSYAKLSDRAETIILNCAECEPLFRVHRQLLSEYTMQIMTALQKIQKAVGAKEVIIAVKPSYKKAAEAVEYLLGQYPGFRLAFLSESYPAGDEIITIYETTGKIIEPGKLPITQGIILYNVETMLNAYNAIVHNHPVCSKHITIAGAVRRPVTVKVPIGITFREAVELAGGAAEEDCVFLNGGIMTGSIAKPNEVVTKTTNAIIVLPAKHPVVLKKQTKVQTDIQRAMSACCQCRTCTDLCSRHLVGYPIQPHAVMRAATKGMTSDTQACLDSVYCSSCGLCQMYSCPQGLSPRTIIAGLKSGLKAAGVRAPENPVFTGAAPDREYKKIPEKRLIARLGVSQYDRDADFDTGLAAEPKRVKIKLRQHIGAGAEPVVKAGDRVAKADMIAAAPEGLGAAVHASVSGTVEAVTDDYILIRTER